MSEEGTSLTVEAQLNSPEDQAVTLTLEAVRFIAKGGWSIVTLVHGHYEGPKGRVVGEYVHKRARQPKAFKHRELEIHREIHHPNIVEVVAWWYEGALDETSDTRYLNLLLAPYCATTFAQLDLPLAEPLVLACTSKILAALEYLHDPERSIAHRDLKLENVLVKLPVHGTDSIEVYLCDFGCAKCILPTDQNGCEVGEQKIRAPELLRQRGYGTYTIAIDVFALGLLLCRLLLGEDLLSSRANHGEQLEEFEKVFGGAENEEEITVILRVTFEQRGRAPPTSPTLSLIAKALHSDPTLRPVASECLQEVHSLEVGHGAEGGIDTVCVDDSVP